MNDIIQVVAVYALPVLFAITLHEAAHGYVAKYFGDATAYLQGRVSLNPFKHIDPFGTVLLPLILSLIPGAMVFGYAKPVPVNFSQLRNPKKHMIWVAFAGPAVNFLMAYGWLILATLLKAGHVEETFFVKVANAGVIVNLIIFAFNLFPLPPLDGGRILVGLLPHRYAYKFAKIEPYGFFILLALLYLKILDFWMVPIVFAVSEILNLLISPLNFFLN